jgi:hypothetical protein
VSAGTQEISLSPTNGHTTFSNIGTPITLNNVTGYILIVQVSVGGTPSTIHGDLYPQVVVSNSTTGYSSTVQGNAAMVNTGQNYLIDSMMGGINTGASNLVPSGTLKFQWRGMSNFWNTTTVNANWQYTILYW